MSDSKTVQNQVTVSAQTTTESPAPARRATGPSVKQIAIVVAILAVGIAVTSLTSDVTKVSEPGIKVVDGRPYLAQQVGDWTGGELEGLTEGERNILPKDTEGSRRVYTNSKGDQIFCSVVLAGREVTSIHRPELCLPGQGWKIQNEFAEPIPVASAEGGALKIMRMNSVREAPLTDGRSAQVRSIFGYWFIGKDRVTPYHWQRIFWTARDRIFHNTNHRWAYVLVHATVTTDTDPSGKGKSEDETMRLVENFVQGIYPTFASN